MQLIKIKNGFTFIELLIVIAVIALAAIIGLPKLFDSKKEPAPIKTAISATVISDLHNCAMKAEAWTALKQTYEGFNAGECAATQGNTITVVSAAKDTYSIAVTNPNAPEGKKTCTITKGGQITCN